MNPDEKLAGWQIVEVGTDNPPDGMATYEVYSLTFVLLWLQARPSEKRRWRLLPIFDGDVEEPVVVSDQEGGRL